MGSHVFIIKWENLVSEIFTPVMNKSLRNIERYLIILNELECFSCDC